MLKVAFTTLCLLLAGCSTAEKEFGPAALLKKYEMFKDMAAALDAKKADLEVAEGRLRSLEKRYEGVAAKDWPRHDSERLSVWEQEVVGLKLSYNRLAADYNAAMAKENYRFCNQGDLPRGADRPLPREFATYISK